MQLEHPLRTLRRRRGFTQADLAARAGISARTVVYIEDGSVRPTFLTRKALLRVLRKPLKAERRVFGPMPDVGRPRGPRNG